MSIEINPEHQKLIDAAIRTGAYTDASQVITRALEVLTAEDDWLRYHRQVIDEKIGRGLAQLDRGEGIVGERVRASLQERKAAFLEKNLTHGERVRSLASSRRGCLGYLALSGGIISCKPCGPDRRRTFPDI